MADDDDLAVEGPDGGGATSSGSGWLSADMGQRQAFRPPRGDEGCDVVVGLGNVAAPVPRRFTRPSRWMNESIVVASQTMWSALRSKPTSPAKSTG